MKEKSWSITTGVFTFVFIPLLNLINGIYSADMYTVKDGQQDFGQTQQVTEVVEAKVNEIPCQINNLQQNQTKKQRK